MSAEGGSSDFWEAVIKSIIEKSGQIYKREISTYKREIVQNLNIFWVRTFDIQRLHPYSGKVDKGASNLTFCKVVEAQAQAFINKLLL